MPNTGSSGAITKAVWFLAALLTPHAFAVDGQVVINQSTLNAGGGTFTIAQSGSYKLSGNLQAKDQATPVIVIAANNVTIDLNGFAITGTSDCSNGISCTNYNPNGTGIETAGFNQYFNITVRNGTIQGMGGDAIVLAGDSFLVEYMHIRSNAGNGMFLSRITPQFNTIVQYNTVEQNGAGIVISGGRVANNVVTENLFDGIHVGSSAPPVLPTGTVTGNVVTNNGGIGLHLAGSVNYIGNSMSGNSGGNVTGGYNQGQNLCGGAACLGAAL